MKLKLSLLAAVAFANSNAASKLFVCPIPQNANLSRADYEALTWVEIKFVGSLGQTGKTTNMLTYDTWGDSVTQKAKGLTDAGSPELEVARDSTDEGQNILKDAGAVGNNNNYAFKELRADGPVGGTGTIRYNRGLVAGPSYPGGRNEDFDLQVFTLGFQQEPLEVAATLAGGVAPAFTVAPAITGTPEVGTELTVSNGTTTGTATITYAYQWYADGVAVSGANLATFTPTNAQIGKTMSARVTAINSAGSANGYATASAVVAP